MNYLGYYSQSVVTIVRFESSWQKYVTNQHFISNAENFWKYVDQWTNPSTTLPPVGSFSWGTAQNIITIIFKLTHAQLNQKIWYKLVNNFNFLSYLEHK